MSESPEPIVLSELDAEVREAVAATREKVAALHAELPRWGLVVWTAGNVSERVVLTRGGETVKTDLFVIKPSGVSYDELTADTMVVCTLDGAKIDDGTPASLTPSSDTAAHAYVYRHMEQVGGVVHTHSTYATAWAARREPIPCALTMMGDEFGVSRHGPRSDMTAERCVNGRILAVAAAAIGLHTVRQNVVPHVPLLRRKASARRNSHLVLSVRGISMSPLLLPLR